MSIYLLSLNNYNLGQANVKSVRLGQFMLTDLAMICNSNADIGISTSRAVDGSIRPCCSPCGINGGYIRSLEDVFKK